MWCLHLYPSDSEYTVKVKRGTKMFVTTCMCHIIYRQLILCMQYVEKMWNINIFVFFFFCKIGKFQMQVLSGCGHSVHEDAPDKVSTPIIFHVQVLSLHVIWYVRRLLRWWLTFWLGTSLLLEYKEMLAVFILTLMWNIQIYHPTCN